MNPSTSQSQKSSPQSSSENTPSGTPKVGSPPANGTGQTAGKQPATTAANMNAMNQQQQQAAAAAAMRMFTMQQQQRQMPGGLPMPNMSGLTAQQIQQMYFSAQQQQLLMASQQAQAVLQNRARMMAANGGAGMLNPSNPAHMAHIQALQSQNMAAMNAQAGNPLVALKQQMMGKKPGNQAGFPTGMDAAMMMAGLFQNGMIPEMNASASQKTSNSSAGPDDDSK